MHLVDFQQFRTKAITFDTSCLSPAHKSPCVNGVHSKRKKFAPMIFLLFIYLFIFIYFFFFFFFCFVLFCFLQSRIWSFSLMNVFLSSYIFFAFGTFLIGICLLAS